MIKQYRKKPVVIEAIQWTGENWDEVLDFCKDSARTIEGERFPSDNHMDVIITTLEGEMRANLKDYIIKGIQGEVYPCKPDIFDATYEAV